MFSAMKRINHLSQPFKLHENTFKLNSMLLNKNFCVKNMDLGKKTYDGVVFKTHSDYTSEIILNQPTKYNALDLKMIKALIKKIRLWVPYNIDGWSSEPEGEILKEQKKIPKVVLFSGEGKAFCAGGDIVSLYNAKITTPNSKFLKDFFRYEYLLDYSITKIIPTQICFWNGAVMGGGVGISINSPFKICTDNSIFAMPEGKIGLFTDVGASYFLPRLLNNSHELGLYLALTGERINGKNLAVTGVASHYVSQDKFDKIKQKIIESVNEKTSKKDLSDLLQANCDYTYDSKKFDFPNKEIIKFAFKFDKLESIFDRLDSIKSGNEKNFSSEDNKSWAEKTHKTLSIQSPLSLQVIWELLKRGTEMTSIEEAFNVEAQVVSGFMEESDFFEGVRALLIEKDNKPKWKHTSIKEVNLEEMKEKYFNRREQIDVDPNN